MVKTPPRSKAKTATARQSKVKKVVVSPPPLVSFSYQDVAYEIDLGKSKVYRRFIEVEKSRQFSIISAYRSGARATV